MNARFVFERHEYHMFYFGERTTDSLKMRATLTMSLTANMYFVCPMFCGNGLTQFLRKLEDEGIKLRAVHTRV